MVDLGFWITSVESEYVHTQYVVQAPAVSPGPLVEPSKVSSQGATWGNVMNHTLYTEDEINFLLGPERDRLFVVKNSRGSDQTGYKIQRHYQTRAQLRAKHAERTGGTAAEDDTVEGEVIVREDLL